LSLISYFNGTYQKFRQKKAQDVKPWAAGQSPTEINVSAQT